MRFFQRMALGVQRFMAGRYGQDALSRHTVWLALIVCILSMFFWRLPLSIVYMLLLFWAFFRTFSRNIPKRRRELAVYQKFTGRISRFFLLQKNKRRDRKTHRYFKCRCGASLRVPKGKGEIVLHCPVCHATLHKKT